MKDELYALKDWYAPQLLSGLCSDGSLYSHASCGDIETNVAFRYQGEDHTSLVRGSLNESTLPETIAANVTTPL